MRGHSDIENAARKRDLHAIADDGGCLIDVARKWRCSTPAVIQWMNRHYPDEAIRKKLAENGRTRAGNYHRSHLCVVDRLRIVAMCQASGWSNARIARGIGISPPALSSWLMRNTNGELQQAIEDLSDDALEQTAA